MSRKIDRQTKTERDIEMDRVVEKKAFFYIIITKEKRRKHDARDERKTERTNKQTSPKGEIHNYKKRRNNERERDRKENE